jgi:hypothetical protein
MIAGPFIGTLLSDRDAVPTGADEAFSRDGTSRTDADNWNREGAKHETIALAHA